MTKKAVVPRSYIGNKIIWTYFDNMQAPKVFEEWDKEKGEYWKWQGNDFLLYLSSANNTTREEEGWMETKFWLLHKIGSKEREE